MLLRRFLPRYLTVPRRLYPDRRKRLDELGIEVERLGKVKQVEKNQKTAETKEKNRAKKAGAQNADAGPIAQVELESGGTTPGTGELKNAEAGESSAEPSNKKRKK